MLKFIFIICITMATSNVLAETSTSTEMLKNGLIEPTITDPLINEVVTYKPIKGHHFNLEAPQECGEQSSITPAARQIECQFHQSGKRNVRLSVCDNAKKYCKQEIVAVNVRVQKSGVPRMKTAPTEETTKVQKKIKAQLGFTFKSMSPNEAVQAISTKKAALVMVSTDWCPPCNMAKEFLLPTKQFKEASKDLLLIYVDGDSPYSDAWKPILKSRFYPSFVVLNKNLESVSLFTNITPKDFFSNLQAGLTVLSDPYSSLEERIILRSTNSSLRTFKDFFISTESILNDEKRWLSYLDTRAEYDKKIQLMERLSQKRYRNQIVISKLQSVSFNGIDKSLSENEAKKKQMELLKSALALTPKENSAYFDSVMTYCGLESQPKGNVSSDCSKYINIYSKHLDQKIIKDFQADNPAQNSISKASYHMHKALLAEQIKNTSDASNHYSKCYDEYNNLYQYSPLKQKSRSVRLEQLYCLKNDNQNMPTDKLALLKSLVKDYPYEETFQRKLSSHYLKNKDYKKAFEYNKLALKYSYGVLWAYNMKLKAEILQGMSKPTEAIATLEKALSEVTLERKDRSSNIIKMLRTQYEKLKNS